MFNKKKCPGCAHKLEGKFNFCPYCGTSIKEKQENQNYGLLGRQDSNEQLQPEVKLPFGLEKMMNSLLKQLESQMNNANMQGANMPKGFNIKITTGKPGQGVPGQGPRAGQNQQHTQRKNIKPITISAEERKRRIALPKKDAESKIIRLGDHITYEINAPGVQQRKDISITKLETGTEIRVYTKDACYVKTIPINADIKQCYIKNKKVYVELKTE